MKTTTRELVQFTRRSSQPSREKPDVDEYVSASRLKTWLRCPLAFKLRYVDGIVIPSSPQLVPGKIVHRGLERYYRFRQRGVKLYPEVVAEYIEKIWDAAIADELLEFKSSDEEYHLKSKR